ncbi:extra-large guanine nucleotide-binding protein 1 [Phtheirospermum japonicum]|uniref:Extra-large guanine nucleotide-binding protein 1 n=1 Tax=Phtheirospermum japonicum TaxID=374723 RepID=A0A830BCK0_9LAMI|nr:extra-large guanine nucleotide-binding protein 1 [Phtheirospermum japonicum]
MVTSIIPHLLLFLLATTASAHPCKTLFYFSTATTYLLPLKFPPPDSHSSPKIISFGFTLKFYSSMSSSIRERTKDIMSVVGALLFGVACGALTAAGHAGTKPLCAILSLRVPSKSSQPCGEQATSMNSRSLPDYLEQRAIQKILLIGYNGSETSTIFKQARVLYKDAPFSVDEREHIKLVIQSHVYSYIGTLLEGREHFVEESLNELRQKQSCDGSSSTLAGTKFI